MLELQFIELGKLSVSKANMRYGKKAPDVSDILPTVRIPAPPRQCVTCGAHVVPSRIEAAELSSQMMGMIDAVAATAEPRSGVPHEAGTPKFAAVRGERTLEPMHPRRRRMERCRTTDRRAAYRRRPECKWQHRRHGTRDRQGPQDAARMV